MLDEVKDMLAARFGQRWLNGVNNQNGIAQDLTVHEGDAIRTSRKFGLVGSDLYISPETEVVATYEVVRSCSSLIELDAVFYTWWGHRASENISFIQREIADDELIYHFITGTPTHGHSGRIVLTGRIVHEVIRRRWDDRLNRMNAEQMIDAAGATSADAPASNS
jgi:hypothetical protein